VINYKGDRQGNISRTKLELTNLTILMALICQDFLQDDQKACAY